MFQCSAAPAKVLTQRRLVQSEALAWWYEALRLLVVSWEEAEDLALVRLRYLPTCFLPSVQY